jgi:hypothetical protein
MTRWRRLSMFVVLCLAVLVRSATAQTEAAKIYVEGGPKQMKEAVLTLLRQRTDLTPVPYAKQPEANINLQKSGGANVKCGNEKAFLPGPSAEDIVSQFREWLTNGPLEKRRAAHAARNEKIATGVAIGAIAGIAVAAAAGGGSGYAAAPATSPELLVFGGRNHDVFLGCLTCSEYDSKSLRNTYGNFGSRYSSTSIANSYGAYGSKYSSEGACNPYGSNPPVIVDGAGNYYGELTMNRYSAKRTNMTSALQWLAATCAE